jgi:hypothetical protein
LIMCFLLKKINHKLKILYILDIVFFLNIDIETCYMTFFIHIKSAI